MLKRNLVYLFATLITFQSVVAIADTHQLFQAESIHQSHDHDHDHFLPSETESQLAFDLISSDHDADKDCNHCCHCHAMTPLFVASLHDSLVYLNADIKTPDYEFLYLSYLSSPETPPPIK